MHHTVVSRGDIKMRDLITPYSLKERIKWKVMIGVYRFQNWLSRKQFTNPNRRVYNFYPSLIRPVYAAEYIPEFYPIPHHGYNDEEYIKSYADTLNAVDKIYAQIDGENLAKELI